MFLYKKIIILIKKFNYIHIYKTIKIIPYIYYLNI